MHKKNRSGETAQKDGLWACAQGLSGAVRTLAVLALLWGSMPSQPLMADVGDGPRAYFPPPVDTNVFSLYGMQISGNSMFNSGIVTPELDLDIDLLVGQYTRTFSLAERYASFTAVQPAGRLVSDLLLPNVPDRGARTKSEGLGDTQLTFTMGIYNLPPLTEAEYAAYQPGLGIGALARVTLPTGEYDASQSANLGANRYSFQLGSPITFAFGNSFLDPQLTTLDFLPSVTFYGSNDDPFNADRLTQKPLYKLEAHLTHNFNAGLWASLDTIYSYGGETETDGLANGNKQRSWGVGASVGVQFSKSLGLKLSYGEAVKRNDSGLDGDFARLVLIYAQL